MNQYDVWCQNFGIGPDDSRTIFAYDEPSAVEIWAILEEVYSTEYWITGGVVAQVRVRECGKTEVHSFRVVGNRGYIVLPGLSLARDPENDWPAHALSAVRHDQ